MTARGCALYERRPRGGIATVERERSRDQSLIVTPPACLGLSRMGRALNYMTVHAPVAQWIEPLPGTKGDA